MDGLLQVKKVQCDNFRIKYYIICSKKDSKGLVSNLNGCSRLMDSASIENDVMWNWFQSTFDEEWFMYHYDNKCYKEYVLKKTLKNKVAV